MNKNIVYKTSHLVNYFRTHRRSWAEFYPSEHWMFEHIGASQGGFGNVLDVGCAVGGLGQALTEKFDISSYTGIDISAEAIEVAKTERKLDVPIRFLSGDIVNNDDLEGRTFETVTSLSVADWNVETKPIIDACWNKVAPGGRLVISLRLCAGKGIHDPEKSYQYITGNKDADLGEHPQGLEKAPYVVFNAGEALDLLRNLSPRPEGLVAYGYWGSPSSTAVTPYDKLVFSVLTVTRGLSDNEAGETILELHLPEELIH